MTTPQQIVGEKLMGKGIEPWFAGDIVEALRTAGYAIVPIKPSEKMIEELARIGDGPMISGEEVWGYMLAAATVAV